MAKMKVDGLGTSGVREVDIPDYPSNSNKSKEEPKKKKVRPVTTATPRNTAKGILSNIFNESIPEAKNTIWEDQIKPGLLDMGANAMYTLIDYIFDAGGKGRRRPRSRRDRINYAERSKNRSKSRDDDYDDQEKPVRGKWNTVVIREKTIAESRAKAQEVWDILEEKISENESVSVGDLFSAVEWSTVYTDFDYGWKTLEGCQYVKDGDGFWFDMTKPVRLE